MECTVAAGRGSCTSYTDDVNCALVLFNHHRPVLYLRASMLLESGQGNDLNMHIFSSTRREHCENSIVSPIKRLLPSNKDLADHRPGQHLIVPSVGFNHRYQLVLMRDLAVMRAHLWTFGKSFSTSNPGASFMIRAKAAWFHL